MSPVRRLPIVAVIGSGAPDHGNTSLSEAIGRLIAEMGFHLLTGGGRGVMADACRGFTSVPDRAGLTLGIIPRSATGDEEKLESDSPYFQTISRILLSPGEHEVFDALPGDRLRKTRHYHVHQGRVFSIDVFEGELEGLVLCETEADGIEQLMSIQPPAFAGHEVTEDPFFTGGNLCRTTRAGLLRKLSAFT